MVNTQARSLVAAALAAALLLAIAVLVARRTPAPAQGPAPQPMQVPLRPPTPMFSAGYAEALGRVADLDEAGAARLERQLAMSPGDPAALLLLMAYYHRADQAGDPRQRAKRFGHVLWLIEHDPGSELLHSPVSRFSPGELAAADVQGVADLWAAASKANPRDAATQWNAAVFFEGLDAELHLRYLEATAAADPNHPSALRPLAHLYALTILGSGPLAERAQAGLAASQNVWVLGNAAYMLQSQYLLSVQRGAPNRRAAELAERTFLRAKALDPKLDRQAILPRLDLAGLERAKQDELRELEERRARFESARGRIRRLPVAAFPHVPPAVAQALTARGCRIPQPEPAAEGVSATRNLIRGEFLAAGRVSWAALCSANGQTTLLVFRHDRDANPIALDAGEEGNYLQDIGGGKIGYSREITPVDRDFIVRHYRAYGGPKPPPIDHQGIDDAFLGKASVTRYFYQGRWLALQGAD